MAKAEQMRCPHCGTVMRKSAAAWVIGEAGIPTEGLPETTPCPACGRGIPVRNMVRGDYDVGGGGGLGAVFLLAWLVSGIAVSAAWDLGFWGGAGLGFVAAAAVTGALALLVGLIRRAFGRGAKGGP